MTCLLCVWCMYDMHEYVIFCTAHVFPPATCYTSMLMEIHPHKAGNITTHLRPRKTGMVSITNSHVCVAHATALVSVITNSSSHSVVGVEGGDNVQNTPTTLNIIPKAVETPSVRCEGRARHPRHPRKQDRAIGGHLNQYKPWTSTDSYLRGIPSCSGKIGTELTPWRGEGCSSSTSSVSPRIWTTCSAVLCTPEKTRVPEHYHCCVPET